VIVPILDLRVKFRLPQAPYDAFTVAIILNVAERVVGVVVDAVSDVLTLPAEAIRPAPTFASSVLDTRYITGLGTADDQMVILLDIERLMAGADMGLIETTLH
jgi:purine-binding chemotaxis protein CheW